MRGSKVSSGLGCVALISAISVVTQPAVGAQPADDAQTTGGIEEITITAQKREENLQTVPIAIGTLSGEELANRGISSFEGVAKATPTITATPYPSSSNTLVLYMRGQGVSDPQQITADGSVGLYQDGFYISRAQLATFDLADVDRVEVLRGPQGTLYGRNTTGGAVNLISRKPTGVFSIKQELNTGSRDYFRSLSVVNLPAVGNLSAKLSLLYSRRDGYVDNIGEGRDYGEESQRAGRLSLRWDAGDAFTADYFFETGDLDSTPIYYQNPSLDGLVPGYVGSGRPNNDTWRPIDLRLSEGEFEGHGLTLSWDINDTLTVRSLTGYRDIQSGVAQDYADAFTDPALPFPTGFVTDDTVSSHQLTQEIQLIGGGGPDSRVEFVGGLFYFKEDAAHAETVDIAIPDFFFFQTTDRFVKADAKSRAAYAQLTWTPPVLEDKLDLTFGARYTKDDRAASRDKTISILGVGVVGQEIGSSNDQAFSKFNPSFTANYRLAEDVSTYLRIATGYKAGGSSESGEIGSFNKTFAPENVETYELGLKSFLANRRVRLNAAVFHSKFDDLQLAFNTNPADLSVLLSLNAGKATVNGLEIDALFAPTEDLNLSVSYSMLDTKIDQVSAPAGTLFDPAANPESPYQVGDNVADVFRLPYAPDNSVNVGADYTFARFGDNALSAHLNYRWQDRTYTSAPTGPAVPNNELYSIESHGVLDARATWETEFFGGHRARVSLYGKNILGKEYFDHVIGQGQIVPLGGKPAGYTFQTIAWAPDPVYGVDLVLQL